MRRGAKARTTKQKARIQRFESLDTKLSEHKSTEKLDISLSGSRLGKQVFEMKNINKRFGDKTVLKDFDYLMKPGDRIGIIGRNGAGKSTLLNLLAGRMVPDEGELIIGQTVKVAYYTQENDDMDENKRMIEYLNETAQMVNTSDGKYITSAQMLERFLFPSNSHGTPIRKLSGGEKRRLYLLKKLMEEPNVLLLDEPTNDLDTQTLTVLEDYLDEFPGVVITVSHDRYFLDKVVDNLLVFEGEGKVSSFFGSYSDYLESQLLKKEVKSKQEVMKQQPEKKKKKMSYKEQKEWEEIDSKIASVELEIEKIAEELSKVGSDFEKAHSLAEKETSLNEELEYLIERWSFLSDLAEGE
jgi:ATP-binding cassette subfamily F protein uup